MCELFALSSQFPAQLTFSLEEFADHGGQTNHHKDGWGLAFYHKKSAQIFREPNAAAFSQLMQFLETHHQPSKQVVSHIRYATQGKVALENTQPFSRELGGRLHLFCHNGHLQKAHKVYSPKRFQPMGDTDSELAFCELLERVSQIKEHKITSLLERKKIIEAAFMEFSQLGPANFLYFDGEYLFVFANRRTQQDGSVSAPGLHYLQKNCHSKTNTPKLSGLSLVNKRNAQEKNEAAQLLLLFASVPLSEENWLPMQENQLLIARQGEIISQFDSM